MGLGLIIALVLSVFVLAILFHLFKRIMPLLLNGIFGIIVFWLFDFFGVLHVPLDVITFLIAALGGIIGVGIVLAFSFFGVPL